jgi:hypothetical protein
VRFLRLWKERQSGLTPEDYLINLLVKITEGKENDPKGRKPGSVLQKQSIFQPF